MPFYLRRIEPLNLGRKVADLTDTEPKSNLVDTKEEWDNRTLANLIRELACLGRHASDIFEALTYEAKILETRTQVLGQKTRKIQSKVEVSIFNFWAFPLGRNSWARLTLIDLKSYFLAIFVSL